MGALRRFENRLEQLVSGAFARAFRSNVQPVELAAALQREVDNSAQILSRNRRLAPNTFHVELSAADHERLAPYGSTLSQELVEQLRQHASEQSYVFTGPVDISFEQADDLTTGRFRVRSAAAAKVSGTAAERPERGRTDVAIELNGRRHPVEQPGLVLGRGHEADLRINDPGVSRRHAELQVWTEGGASQASVVDLGSTNGVLVNGRRVQQARLGDGDTVQIGNTSFTVHIAGQADGGADV